MTELWQSEQNLMAETAMIRFEANVWLHLPPVQSVILKKETTTGEGGMVAMGTGMLVEFNVNVTEKPEEVMNMTTYLIIAAVIIAVIIIWYLLRKKK